MAAERFLERGYKGAGPLLVCAVLVVGIGLGAAGQRVWKMLVGALCS